MDSFIYKLCNRADNITLNPSFRTSCKVFLSLINDYCEKKALRKSMCLNRSLLVAVIVDIAVIYAII